MLYGDGLDCGQLGAAACFTLSKPFSDSLALLWQDFPRALPFPQILAAADAVSRLRKTTSMSSQSCPHQVSQIGCVPVCGVFNPGQTLVLAVLLQGLLADLQQRTD